MNKQYSEEDYNRTAKQLIEKMIEDKEWGEFIPMKYSYFAYDESVSDLYFPKTREEAEKLGAIWQANDYSLQFDGEAYQPNERIEYYKDVEKQKELLNGILKCQKSGKAFRVVPQELRFYLKHNIPVPILHPEERYHELLKNRNKKLLFDRQCDCTESGHDHENRCKKKFQTTYAPDKSEKVYCEECYQRSVA